MLEHGHLWGKREVVIPIGAVARVETDAVVLTLSKDEVGALESIASIAGETRVPRHRALRLQPGASGSSERAGVRCISQERIGRAAGDRDGCSERDEGGGKPENKRSGESAFGREAGLDDAWRG